MAADSLSTVSSFMLPKVLDLLLIQEILEDCLPLEKNSTNQM